MKVKILFIALGFLFSCNNLKTTPVNFVNNSSEKVIFSISGKHCAGACTADVKDTIEFGAHGKGGKDYDACVAHGEGGCVERTKSIHLDSVSVTFPEAYGLTDIIYPNKTGSNLTVYVAPNRQISVN